MSRGKKPVNDIPAKFVDRAESGMSVYGADGVMGTAMREAYGKYPDTAATPNTHNNCHLGGATTPKGYIFFILGGRKIKISGEFDN